MGNHDFLHQASDITILVVDDDDLTRKMLAKMVGRLEYNVVEATNGFEALEAYAKHTPNLVLLDAMMPKLNGFEVCRKLNETYGKSTAPVIMVTALGDKSSIDSALDAGAFDYITKPFNAGILRNRIARLIDNRLAQQTIVERNQMLEWLNLVSSTISSTLDVNEILDRLAEAATKSLNMTSAYICNVNISEDTTTVLTEYYEGDEVSDAAYSDRGAVYSLTKDFPNTIHFLTLPEGYAIIYPDDSTELSPPEIEHFKTFGVKTAVMIPLRLRSELLGYIELWETRHKRIIRGAEIDLLRSIASQAAQALDNAFLYEQAQNYAKELEETNAQLDAYGHTIAHDLKNPINIIINYASMGRMVAAGDPQMTRYLTRIEQNGERMAVMVEQLLRFATLRDAREVLESVDLVPVIQNAILRFETDIQEHKVQLQYDQSIPHVLGHTQWLEEVVANFVGNAIKYRGTENTNPMVRISHTLKGRRVRLSVIDNGVGIPPEEADKLFKMFSRLESRPTGVTGFGLGLSIVKRIIEKLHGSVGFESNESAGSTFWFELPAVDGSA